MSTAIVESLKAMIAKIEADVTHKEWLYEPFDKFIAELHELKEITRIDVARANAPKPLFHGVLEAVESAVAKVEEKVEAVVAKVEEKVEEVVAKVKKAKTVEAPAPAVEESKPADNNNG